MAKASSPGSPENIADIESIVKRWASEVYEYSKTREQAKIPKEVLQFNINWKNVKFHFDSPSYDILPFLGSSSSTGAKQNVQPQRGFTRGMEFGLKLATPCEVLEANAGFKREMSVFNIGEDTIGITHILCRHDS